MKKSGLIALIIVVVLLLGGLVWAVAHKGKSSYNASGKDQPAASMDMPSDSGNGTNTKAANQNTVNISNYEFTPAHITVKAGTKVTWTNQDSVEHTVTADDGNGPDSELLIKGKSYSFTFDKAGTYTYHCTPHPYMKGTVTVTE